MSPYLKSNVSINAKAQSLKYGIIFLKKLGSSLVGIANMESSPSEKCWHLCRCVERVSPLSIVCFQCHRLTPAKRWSTAVVINTDASQRQQHT
ncbi:hypothetical protein CEXT_699301, partial [Caerostris extrusa]